MPPIDLTYIEQQLLMIVGTVVLALAGWAAQRFITWIGLKNGAQVTATVDSAADKMVQFGVMKAQDEINAKGWNSVDVQNSIARTAAAALVQKFPQALANAGLDPSTPEGAQRIRDIVTRALPASVASAAASPITPPADAGKP